MRKILICLLLAIVYSASTQLSAQIVQVTNNATSDWKQQVSGTKIVWFYFDGAQWDIFQHDILTGTTTQITNTSENEDVPQISGDSITWQGQVFGDLEIFLYDGFSTTQITNNFGDDYDPRISAGNIVWRGDTGGDYEIYHYDGSTTTQMTTNSVYDGNPRVSGNNMIWTEDSAGFANIMYYDGSTVTQQSFGAVTSHTPDLSGAEAVWMEGGSMYYFDGSTKTLIASISVSSSLPEVSQGNVVWHDSNNDVWVWNAVTTVSTMLSFYGINPKISGNNIIWLDWDGADMELFLSTGDTVIQLTDDNEFMSGPIAAQIDGDVVTWYVSDGNDAEIFYYMIPSAGFSVSDTTPCAGDTVQFTNLSLGAQSYEWFVDGVPFSTDTNPTYTFPTNASYTIMLVSTDTFLTDTSTMVITVNQNPSVSYSSTNVTCNGSGNGAAIASASGGAPSYTYTWVDSLLSPVGFGSTISFLSPGNYGIVVIDANTCIDFDTVTITEPVILNLTAVLTNISCAGGSDGVVNTTVTGGTSPFTYLWGDGYTGADTNNVVAGLYAITVTDANNCVYNTSFSLTEPSLMGSGYTVVDVLCNGDSTGSINVSPSGGVLPYTFLWSNGDATEDVSQITAGSYTYTITDAQGCIETDNVTIAEPTALGVLISGTDVSCTGFSDGLAGATVSGGAGPYTFSWSNFAITPSISGISAGTYTLTVTDNNNCINVDSVVIAEAQSLNVTLTSSNVTCNGACDGLASVSVTGGTVPYSYSWSSIPPQTDSVATGLCPGVYNVDVTDALGCQTTPNVTITEPLVLVVATSATNSTCLNSDGTVTGVASGGTAPYTYTWSGGSTVNLGVGTYTVNVVDSNGCTVTDSATVTEIATVVPICIVTVDSTSSHNEVVWEKPAVTNIDSFRIYRNILGNYTWIGSNSYGELSEFIDTTNGINPNTTSYRYVITAVDVCGNESDTSSFHETIHLTVNQGIPPIMNLIWDNYVGFGFGDYYILRDSTMLDNWEVIDSVTNFSFTYTDLTPPQSGVLRYRIDVIPPSVCVATKQKNWNASKSNTSSMLAAPLSVSTTSTTANDPACDGTAQVLVTGGIAPYTYLWDDPLAQATALAMNLCSGDYTVLITDANGDTISSTVNVPGTILPLASTTSSTNANSPTCDGTATVIASGGLAPYTYLWSDPATQTNASAIALCAGDFSVLVTDANGDTTSANVNVASGPVALSVGLSSTSANSPACDGTGVAIPGGGVSPYNYLWNDPSAQTAQVAVGLCVGNYTVTVTDAQGDTVSGTVNIPNGSVGINDIGEEGVRFHVAPNPYDVSTEISYVLSSQVSVSLIIYNMMGESIVELVNADQTAGAYRYQFGSEAYGVAPGIYLAILRLGSTSYALRIVEL